MFLKAILAVAIMAIVLAGLQTWRLEREQALSASSAASLTTCESRLINFFEDLADDQAIDNMSSDDLRSAPAHWMLPSEH